MEINKERLELVLFKLFGIVFPYRINEKTKEVICYSWSDPAKEICRLTFELIEALAIMK